MTRVLEPDDARLGVFGDHLLGRLDGDIVVLASEDEEYRNLGLAQHPVLVLAGDHAVEQGDNPLVLGDENLFGEVLDILQSQIK